MNEFFKATTMFAKSFSITDEGIVISKTLYKYESIDSITIIGTPTLTMIGYLSVVANGQEFRLPYKFSDMDRLGYASIFAREQRDIKHGISKDYLYKLSSPFGGYLEVYDSYIILDHVKSVTPVGAYSGNKKILYKDITSIQTAAAGADTVGFITFEVPGSPSYSNGIVGAVKNENTITFRIKDSELANTIVEFVEKKRNELDNTSSAAEISSVSQADEILKFKNLMDAGIITKEEFEQKKKQLLGL